MSGSALTQFEAQQAAKEQISHALDQLATARQAKDFDAVEQRVYISVLAEFPSVLVARACDYYARHKATDEYVGRMPGADVLADRCRQLREADVEEAQQARLAPPPGEDARGPRYACARCLDIGWDEFWCCGSGPLRRTDPAAFHLYRRELGECGRVKPHAGHAWVARCGCVGWNPVLADARQAQRTKVASGRRGRRA